MTTTTEGLRMTTTDQIEKKLLLHASKARIWKALTDAKEFGTWFRVNLNGPFKVGRAVKGNVTHPGYEHVVLEMLVERMDPETLFSYRWHPHAIDSRNDYSSEPTTLVEFRLEEVTDGTMLTIVESGFDKIPAGRRDEAFRGNDSGWTGQLKSIKRHVES